MLVRMYSYIPKSSTKYVKLSSIYNKSRNRSFNTSLFLKLYDSIYRKISTSYNNKRWTKILYRAYGLKTNSILYQNHRTLYLSPKYCSQYFLYNIVLVQKKDILYLLFICSNITKTCFVKGPRV